MKQLLMATQNKNKLKEVKTMLEPLGYQVLTLDDVNLGHIDVVEDGDTFEHNAMKKAREIAHAANMPVLADDSGLMVDALNGAPGVYSARYSGENANATSNNIKLLEALKGVKPDNRGAKFVCVMAYVEPDGQGFTKRGEAHGRILESLSGEGGFGYDPLFFDETMNKTYAQMAAEEKNKLSHRAKALKLMREALEKQ